MNQFDDFKSFMFRKPISDPDSSPDTDYLKHAEAKRFEASPTGRAIRELEHTQAQQDTSVTIEPQLTEPAQDGSNVFMSNITTTKDGKGKTLPLDKTDYRQAQKPTLPTGPIDLQTGEKPGQMPVLGFNDVEGAKAQKEQNRQDLLKQNLAATDKTHPQAPPSLADTAFNLLDYPGHVVREAIAAHVEAQTGEKVDPEKLGEYVTGKMQEQGKTVTEGDKVLFDLTSKILTDPVNFLPVVGLPTDAYKAGGRAIKGAYEGLTDASKVAGVDLAGDRGSMLGKVLTPTEGQKWAFGKDETPTFYSPTQRLIEAKMPNSATPAQVQGIVKGGGISQEEAKWMDLDEFLEGKEKVSKEEVLKYVEAHQMPLEEVQLTSEPTSKPSWDKVEGNDTHYQSYTLPGGKNYREFLLKVPGAGYKAPHFGEQGEDALLHFRTTDREVMTEDGPQRVLFVEEVQSDLHQQGRKHGYTPNPQRKAELEAKRKAIEAFGSDATPEQKQEWVDVMNELHPDRKQIPALPFQKDWVDLGIKRILRLAAEEGYDRVAWTTGAQQAERYDLAKQVSVLRGVKHANGTYDLGYAPAEGGSIRKLATGVTQDKLADTVGKDLAEKIVNQAEVFPEHKDYSGLDLKVGGEGMKGFYDDILPKTVNKYVKKWGGKVEESVIKFDNAPDEVVAKWAAVDPEHPFVKKNRAKVHSLPITPQMFEAVVNNPQSLFGSVFQSLEDHFKTLPKMVQETLRAKLPAPKQFKKLSEEGGYVAFGPVYMLTRSILGSIAGANAGDPENAIRNALIGAGVGALASPSMIRSLAQTIKGVKGGGVDASLGLAQAATKKAAQPAQAAPTATPIASLQAQYKQLVDDARRGVRHDADVVTDGDLLVDTAKIDEAYVKNLYPGTALNVEQTYALHKVLTESGKKLVELASTVTDDVSAEEFLKALWVHGSMLDAKRLGAMAEAGRAERIYGVDAPADMQAMKAFLNQFSDLMGKMKEGMNPLMVSEMVKSFKTPEQMAVFAKNAVKPGLKDAFLGLWINALLSGPHTHIANAISNGATLGWGIAERQFAPVFGGNVRPGEAAAMIHGVYESFVDGLRTFWEVFRGGDMGGKIEMHHTPSFQEAGLTGVPGKALDYISAFFQGAGGRMLSGADAFFKAIAFRAEARARALREAYNIANAENLYGKAARDRVNELYAQYMTDIPEDIAKDADKFSAYVTFTKNLGPAGAWLQEGSAKHPAVKLVIPFVKAPINIFKYANERTPWGLFAKSFRDDIAAGGARADLAMAKLSMGSMTMGAAALLAMDGIITGGGPDPKQFPDLIKDMKDNGWMAYSINVSAAKRKANGESTAWQKGDQFVGPFSKVEPLGSLFSMAADYVEIMSNKKADETTEEMAHHMVMATVKSMSSKTFIKGLSQTMLALTFPEEFFDKTLDRQAVSLVPIVGSSLSRKIAQQIDPIVRHSEGFIEELKKNVPGLSKDLPPELNRWGEPVYRNNGIGPDIASPFYETTYKKDPVNEAIMKNKVNIPAAPDNLFGMKLDYEEKITLHRIIAKEVDVGGMNLHDHLKDMIENDYAYKHGSEGPDGRKALLLRSRIQAFTRAGEFLMLQKYPKLMQELQNMKQTGADLIGSDAPNPREIQSFSKSLSLAGN